MKNHQLIVLGLTFLVLNACKETPIDQEAEAENLMELSKAWAESVKTRNVDEMISYWADDAILMSPNEAAVVGIDSLRAMVERSMKIPGFDISWKPQEAYVSKGGDLGYVIIKNYMTMPIDTLGNTRTIYNKGVEIWKKQTDGSWKNVVDISNADPSITSID
ncbi:YybH family protein [Flagellimonas sp.]|uniref:YybH family protein n=1 Tax=Flagellimonas sp. TaxID=2058762 RepID=UPI003F49B9BD